MEDEPVPQTPTQVLAARVQELRKGRGWSQARLAEEMTKRGIPWERMVVTKLEAGKRQGVTVAEWLALAYVLDVAPVHLVVPVTDVDRPVTGGFVDVEPVPGQMTTPGRMRAWIRGQLPIGDVDPRRYFSQVPESEWQPPTRPAVEGEQA